MKTIAEIIKTSNSPFAKLINRTKESQNLEFIFHATLDATFNKYCHFANYKNSTLTVTIGNISIATRFRYAIPDIIKNLQIQPEFKNLTKIRYTIAPTLKTDVAKSKNKHLKISHYNEILWQQTLANLKKKEISKKTAMLHH
ncbi:MAG: DciA family protein [Coxiellaceae bacterium]|jgi:hypothetical protein|nr:DciA family protein [Coxiellaceae bacterium]